MMRFFDRYAEAIKVVAYIIGALLIVASYLCVFWLGHHMTAQKYELELSKANNATTTAVAAKEHEMQGTIDTITEERRKEQDDAKTKYDALVARARAGNVRVYADVAKCTPAISGTGVEHQQARAELLPEVVASIIDVARDADDTVRDLNECVDKYNAVRSELAR